MDRLRIWIIPGIITLLVIGGLLYFRGRIFEEADTPGRTITVEVEKTKPKGFATSAEREPTQQEKAKEDANAMESALSSGDLSDCAKITWNEELRKQCEDNINYALILKSGDEAACKKLNDEILRIKCLDKIYLSLAVDQGNASICEKITDLSLKQMCLDQVSALIARNATSVNDCASIQSELLRKQCEDNFYLKTGARELDVTSCDNISDPLMAQQCRTTVTKNIQVMEVSKAAAANNPISTKTSREILEMCNKLTGEKATMCKDAVYPKLAFDERDLSYCEFMSDRIKANECIKEQTEKINTYLLRQAIASNDKTLCNQITDAELQNICKNS